MENAMELRGVRKVYTMGQEKVVALDHIDLDVYKGEIMCLLGPSGSGKSTLLNMMAGLEKPTDGTIFFSKFPIHKMSEDQLAEFRRKYIGFVFQQYNLVNTLTALENVTLPLIFKGESKRRRNAVGKDMMDQVGLGERMYHKPPEMSGGQQQRVSIARAFVNRPELIFADEPTGNLDTKTSDDMMKMMVRMVKKEKKTLVIVTHDEELSEYADRIVHIRDGNIQRIEKNEHSKADAYLREYEAELAARGAAMGAQALNQ
ncbi:macrolide ABC transporter ATP-binding protein [Lachnospiraceae bacterium oral taxon 500]|nr:macrolide ABC transporter ATP-binding protein [Lachnospiraceae bacterium oral taxon 500]